MNYLKQGHYLVVGNKVVPFKGKLVIAFIAVFFFASIMAGRTVQAEKVAKACADIRSAGLNPQALFDTNPTLYARLDRDHDGFACESNN